MHLDRIDQAQTFSFISARHKLTTNTSDLSLVSLFWQFVFGCLNLWFPVACAHFGAFK